MPSQRLSSCSFVYLLGQKSPADDWLDGFMSSCHNNMVGQVFSPYWLVAFRETAYRRLIGESWCCQLCRADFGVDGERERERERVHFVVAVNLPGWSTTQRAAEEWTLKNTKIVVAAKNCFLVGWLASCILYCWTRLWRKDDALRTYPFYFFTFMHT